MSANDSVIQATVTSVEEKKRRRGRKNVPYWVVKLSGDGHTGTFETNKANAFRKGQKVDTKVRRGQLVPLHTAR